jgi:hypothetical protein
MRLLMADRRVLIADVIADRQIASQSSAISRLTITQPVLNR